jgi:diguanylate cyclase (GGDEF)-like protein
MLPGMGPQSGGVDLFSTPRSRAALAWSVIAQTLLIVGLGLTITLGAVAFWFGLDPDRLIRVGDEYWFSAWLASSECVLIGSALVLRGNRALYRLALARDELRRVAELDPLTGLLNRRGFNARVEAALANRAPDARPVAALLIDLDHFKRVNDTHGHAFGDAALRRLAEALREIAESASAAIVARYGGEEFVVMLVDAGLDEARRFASRVREAYSSRPVEWNGASAHVTMSVGLAAVRDVTSGIGDLIAKADMALYEAKRAGRDRIAATSLSLAS